MYRPMRMPNRHEGPIPDRYFQMNLGTRADDSRRRSPSKAAGGPRGQGRAIGNATRHACATVLAPIFPGVSDGRFRGAWRRTLLEQVQIVAPEQIAPICVYQNAISGPTRDIRWLDGRYSGNPGIKYIETSRMTDYVANRAVYDFSVNPAYAALSATRGNTAANKNKQFWPERNA